MSTLRLPYQGNSSKPGYPIQLQANQIATGWFRYFTCKNRRQLTKHYTLLRIITGLAIDCVEGKVFWSDYIGQKIKSSNYKGKNTMTLVNSGKFVYNTFATNSKDPTLLTFTVNFSADVRVLEISENERIGECGAIQTTTSVERKNLIMLFLHTSNYIHLVK